MEASPHPQAAVACADLVVRHGEVTALAGVSLRIDVGERVAFIGPSGAGKSTLLNVIAGLVPPSSGHVRALGVDVTTSASRDHRRRIGFVPQHLGLASSLRVAHSVNAGRLGSQSTVASLASLVRLRNRAEITQALDAVGLADRIDARTGDLSGGEQQRVAVARTLVQSPELLLADEPTSSVDPAIADQVMGALSAGDRTVIVTAHDAALAIRHTTRVIGLRDGKIAFDLPSPDVSTTILADLYDQS